MIKKNPIYNFNLLVLLIACFTCIVINAQNDSLADKLVGNEFIQKFPDAITLRLEFNDHINSFEVNDKGNDLKYTVSPNLQARTSISVQFRSIDIEIGFTPEFLKFAKDEDLYGKTKTFHLGFKTLLGQWLQGLEYSHTKGYYLDDINIDLDGNILTFPELRVTNIGGSTEYIFNPNFSYRARTNQNEWQKKSAGSFVPGVLYYYTRFNEQGKDNTTSLEFVVTPAYHYNLVIAENFLFSAGTAAGIGINNSTTKFKEDNFKESLTSLATFIQFTGGVGYNSKTFYAGVLGNLRFNNYNDGRQERLEDKQIYGNFYVGYRFDAPKIVLETAQKVNSLLGLKK